MVQHYRSSRSTYLGGTSQKSQELERLVKLSSLVVCQGGHLEITMNLPRLHSFTQSSSMLQRLYYLHLFDEIKNVVSPNNTLDFVIEFCKSGHTHLHAHIVFDYNIKMVPVGAIADTVKRFCRVYNSSQGRLKEKHKLRYVDKLMYYMDNHYRSPSIDVRYIGKDPMNIRLEEWKNYMNKCVLPETT